jgi:hypothetical protein
LCGHGSLDLIDLRDDSSNTRMTKGNIEKWKLEIKTPYLVDRQIKDRVL